MSCFVCLFITMFCISAQAKVLRVSGIEAGPHVVYTSESSRPGGLVPQFLDLYLAPDLKAKFNMTIEWHQAPNARLLKELETGELDMLCFLGKTPEREKLYLFSKEHFISGQPSMIVRKDFIKGTEVTNLSIFKNKTIAMMSGVLVPSFIAEQNIHVYPLTGFNISDQTLSLLESGKIDGVFIYLNQVAEFIAAAHKPKDILKVVKLPLDNFKVYVAFKKTISPDLRELIEQTFIKYRPEYEEMLKKK